MDCYEHTALIVTVDTEVDLEIRFGVSPTCPQGFVGVVGRYYLDPHVNLQDLVALMVDRGDPT
jgi:hypothetical protein